MRTNVLTHKETAMWPTNYTYQHWIEEFQEEAEKINLRFYNQGLMAIRMKQFYTSLIMPEDAAHYLKSL